MSVVVSQNHEIMYGTQLNKKSTMFAKGEEKKYINIFQENSFVLYIIRFQMFKDKMY